MERLVRITLVVAIGLAGSMALVGCDSGQSQKSGEEKEEGEHAVVESGTYTGTITEVNAEEDEIYVDAEGTELELYFIEETKLTKGGETVDFSALEKGQKVRVEVEKVGKRLDPMSVEILE